MKTSLASLKNAVILCAALFAIIFGNTVSNAQNCGFSTSIDSAQKLTFFSVSGLPVTKSITIKNTTGSDLTLIVITQGVGPGFDPFFVPDSSLTISAGKSVSVDIIFFPDSSAFGTQLGDLLIINDNTRCEKTFALIGSLSPEPCLITEHELSYEDPVLIGTSATHSFRLTNPFGAPVQISDVILDDTKAGFQVTSSLPMTIPSHSSDHFLNYTFSPTSDYSGTFFNTTFATIDLKGDSISCTSLKVLLIGNVAKPSGGSGIDTTVRGLYPSETRTLAIQGNGAPTTMQYTFRNNLSVPVMVNNVSMKYGTYFSVTGTNPQFPTTLLQDQDLTVSVRFTAQDNQLHTDSLVIDANHNLQQTSSFAIIGKQLTEGGKVSETLPQGVEISITPNPASEFVTIEAKGIRAIEVEVLDLLGKEIATSKTSSVWQWDASKIPAGSYILRIAGESLAGEYFITSKKVILKK